MDVFRVHFMCISGAYHAVAADVHDARITRIRCVACEFYPRITHMPRLLIRQVSWALHVCIKRMPWMRIVCESCLHHSRIGRMLRMRITHVLCRYLCVSCTYHAHAVAAYQMLILGISRACQAHALHICQRCTMCFPWACQTRIKRTTWMRTTRVSCVQHVSIRRVSGARR